MGGGDNLTKVPGHSMTIIYGPLVSLMVSPIWHTTSVTINPLAMPKVDSTFPVMDDVLGHICDSSLYFSHESFMQSWIYHGCDSCDSDYIGSHHDLGDSTPQQCPLYGWVWYICHQSFNQR